VYDYVDGKADWLGAGHPTEGTNAERPRAGDIARKDAPTCRLDEPLPKVRQRVLNDGWNVCVVVNESSVVLGILGSEQLENEGDDAVERVMRPGPSTFRPHVSIEEMAHYMVDHKLDSSPITTSDGRLVGVLTQEDAARATHELLHEGNK
jgi:predicted transcriptional regulator